MPHKPSFHVILTTATLAISLAFGPPANAGEGLGCPVNPGAIEQLTAEIDNQGLENKEMLRVTADRFESFPDGTIILSGNVIILRGEHRIRTERAVYKKSDNTIEATGNVKIDTLSSGSYSSRHSFLDLTDNTGYAEIGGFNLSGSRGRGFAQRIVFVAKGRMKLKKVRFTTCHPDRQDWYLKAREIDINQNTATGTARHARLHVKGIPIFYAPYISFPLGDQRRSGFLLPDFGNTDKMGVYVTAPYYWNIAPHYDATLKPRYMSNRGMQLQTEFRYLDRNHNGVLELETLPNDNVTGTTRNGLTYRHHHRFSRRFTARADINWVSDIDYFDDFATQLSATSQTHLPQTLQLDYLNHDWKLSALASAFQTIDKSIATGDHPYTRLPQLLAEWRPRSRNQTLNYAVSAGATAFQHDSKESAKRLNLKPTLFYPMRAQYGFAVPRLTAHYTQYFNRTLAGDGGFATAIASMDAGLLFERPVSPGGISLTQTLEPRLFYVYSPHVDQSGFPVFDTSVPDFSFSSLFQENRFIGSDRVGDTHQATLALSTRLRDNRSGSERLSMSVGQTLYFADRHVNLPSATVTDTHSDIAGELSAWLGRSWYVRSSVQWDTGTSVLDKNNHFLQYQPDKTRILNIGYRYDSATQELVDVSTQWPLRGKWTLLARSQYSLRDQQNQDSFAGVRYDTCCWSLRALVGRRIDQDSNQVSSFAFQLVFKGLAGFESGVAGDMPMDLSAFH